MTVGWITIIIAAGIGDISEILKVQAYQHYIHKVAP